MTPDQSANFQEIQKNKAKIHTQP